MSAPAAAPVVDRRWFSDPDWDEIARRAPKLAATLRRYVIDLPTPWMCRGPLTAESRAPRPRPGNAGSGLRLAELEPH
jgi:hypothetical protein